MWRRLCTRDPPGLGIGEWPGKPFFLIDYLSFFPFLFLILLNHHRGKPPVCLTKYKIRGIGNIVYTYNI